MARKSRSKRKGKADLIVQPPKGPSKRRPRKPKRKASPVNPQATFTGLPAELRLEVYSHVYNESTLRHVHHTGIIDGVWDQPRFFWTACKKPNPDYPMLCANPKWSGLCNEEDRCTSEPDCLPESDGWAALRRTSKRIYQETQDFKQRGSTVSIHAKILRPWINHLKEVAPKQLETLRQLTVTGLDINGSVIDDILPDIKNLGTLGFQTLLYVPNVTRMNNPAQNWPLLQYARQLPSQLKVVIETYTYRNGVRDGPTKELQFVSRIVKKAAEKGVADSGWDFDNLEVNVAKFELVNASGDAVKVAEVVAERCAIGVTLMTISGKDQFIAGTLFDELYLDGETD
ncbi:hypothetical protein EJ04DRAFT_576698 [Polyplosphaeria fusca]|uniref:Uncharacterized protein n=1 Tax=Polyplosphaeria fusca TaxID=682080 RepID=A0A9P4V316_9PLEO|nr:hypothetical protein EJ04DRAFT_576698 [Polyplosphaeria fusca]